MKEESILCCIIYTWNVGFLLRFFNFISMVIIFSFPDSAVTNFAHLYSQSRLSSFCLFIKIWELNILKRWWRRGQKMQENVLKKNGTLIRKRYSLDPRNCKIVQLCIRIHCVIENEGIQFWTFLISNKFV